MACRSCGQKRSNVVIMNAVEKAPQELYDTGDFLVVKFNGPNSVHYIGSPTGVITKYNLQNYGRGKRGQFLLVHRDDIVAKPSLFVKLSDDVLTAAENLLGLQQPQTITVEPTVVVPEKEQEIVADVDTEAQAIVSEIAATAIKEAEEIARANGAEGRIIKRSEAIPLKEFAEEFGFTHHLQVLAKVKSGELLSFKNESDAILVYHIED